jgi:hypothetical protein
LAATFRELVHAYAYQNRLAARFPGSRGVFNDAHSHPEALARISASIVVPVIIADAGDRAAKRFLEFFAATIRNKNTCMAYYGACVWFFAWCDEHKLGALADIEPLHVAAYIETMQSGF